MEKWFRQILQGEHSLFRLSLPFRVRLFNVLALVGGMISLINGISSYVNNQDSVILGLNLGIAVLSFVLLFYAYKSGRYQFCYVVTIIIIFLMMFPYLFFKSGGYKGGMVSFYIFGILFTVFMLEGKVMFFTAFMEMVVYIATIIIAYQNPQMVVWFSSEKEVVMDLLIGFCASSISVAAVMYLHFRMYNKQQEILEEARIEAQSANKAKSAFLANMSHEIRTPINVMLGMNEMILRESESEEIRQYAKSIERSGGYLISLINNILDISRIESGKMEIEEGKYELRQLLDEVMLIAEKQAEQKSLKMNLIFDKTLPAYLIGDVIHIKQILLNLINNAVKYTKEGQIDIKVSKNEEETKLIFEVKDTGIGIKEENLPVLFDAFMRVDSKKNKKIKGTGLGLAIAKQLAEQMDGMIWVESVYGKGSSFFVQLPMKKVSDGKISNVEWKETDERKRRSFVAPQAKILIVDDNPENLMVTRSLLKRTAVFVDTAASGEECVHKVRQNVYDLILLDYIKPLSFSRINFLSFPSIPHPPYCLNVFCLRIFRQFLSHSPDQFRNNTAVTFRIITTHLFVYPLPVKNLSWIHGQKLNDCIFQLRKLQIIFTDLNPLCSIINTEVSVESVFRLPFMTLLTLQMCNNTSIQFFQTKRLQYIVIPTG